MNLTKQFFKYVSQNIFGLLGTSCYILADTYFIAQAAGTDGVAMLNLCLPIYNFIFAIGSMLGLGAATRYAILRAQGDERSERYFSNALLWALVFALPFMLAGVFCPEVLLRLMGGDVIGSIGICDVRPGVSERWEFELNQIQLPGPYDALPPVEIVPPERLFDGDVFLFCASRFVPDTAVKTGDVRMAQYQLNRELAALYARKAREARYRGLFCVVSDPVDPLCRAVLTESNRAPGGGMDYQGLLTCQVRGFGLGVMNARAAYYARQDPRFASFLTDGRTFGPHGEDLVVANSIDRYDDGLSRLLTERTVHANLQMREMGFKPYVAPALSSGALSLLLCLRGQWHCSSTYLGGVFMGARNRVTAAGTELERLPLPRQLQDRLQTTMDRLRAID